MISADVSYLCCSVDFIAKPEFLTISMDVSYLCCSVVTAKSEALTISMDVSYCVVL